MKVKLMILNQFNLSIIRRITYKRVNMIPNVKNTNKVLAKRKFFRRTIKFSTKRIVSKLIIKHNIYGYKRTSKINGLKI